MPKQMSISMNQKGSRTSIGHNNRTLESYSDYDNRNIDLSRTSENVYLKAESLTDLYHREFDQALENYNRKQSRSDRKIDDYMSHVRTQKNREVQYEVILQLGGKDDYWQSSQVRDESMWEWAKSSLEHYFSGFEERNPNLKVYNAVIHMDESTPHMHLNFVPVADGYKRGLEKQVSMTKALVQQGFQHKDKREAYKMWLERETGILEQSLNERGFERIRPGVNDIKNHKVYKDIVSKAMAEVEGERTKIQIEKRQVNHEIERLKSNVSQLETEISDKKKALQIWDFDEEKRQLKYKIKKETVEVEQPTGEKNIFGREKTEKVKKTTGNVIVSEKFFNDLKHHYLKNSGNLDSLKRYLNTDEVVQQNGALSQENKALNQKVKDQEWELIDLKNNNDLLKYDLSDKTKQLAKKEEELQEMQGSVEMYQQEYEYMFHSRMKWKRWALKSVVVLDQISEKIRGVQGLGTLGKVMSWVSDTVREELALEFGERSLSNAYHEAVDEVESIGIRIEKAENRRFRGRDLER